MITICYWPVQIGSGDIGHVSMFWGPTFRTFDQKTTANYASWWPGADLSASGLWTLLGNLTFGGKAELHTLKQDIDAEGRSPSIIEINGLNEKAIQAAWDYYKGRLRYGLWFDNCATTIAHLLRAGGACLIFKTRLSYELTDLWSPARVTTFAAVVNEFIDELKVEIAAGKTPTLGDTANHGVMNHFDITKRVKHGGPTEHSQTAP